MPHRAARDHAVVFVPAAITDPAEFAAIAAPCLERIEACGYVFAGIVRSWPDARELLEQGRAHVVIVADRRHLPPGRRPRVESIADPVRTEPPESRCVVPPEVTAPQRHRRPRRVE